MNIEPIARIHTDFPTKFGVPRQSGLASGLVSTIVFEPPYRNPDCLRGCLLYTSCRRVRTTKRSPSAAIKQLTLQLGKEIW